MNEHKCTYIGHQDERASFLCFYHDCKEQNRTLCCICMKNQLQHQHELLGSNHFIEINNFIKYNENRLKQLFEQQEKQFNILSDKVSKSLKDIANNMTELSQIFHTKYQELKVQYKTLNETLKQSQLIQQVNQQQGHQQQATYGKCINEINKFYSKYVDELQKIIDDSQRIISNSKTVFEQLKAILDEKYLGQGYQSQKITSDIKAPLVDQNNQYIIQCSQLSHDQRYLVTCFYYDNKKLQVQKSQVKITDVILNYELLDMEYANKITACDFSIPNEKLQEQRLYLADDCGNINILALRSGSGQFNWILNRKHKTEIQFIKSLDERRLILSDREYNILIIDTVRDRQNQKINLFAEIIAKNVHLDLVPSLDYYEQKLVTCSHDLSIKIWKVGFDNLEQFIHKKKCHEEKIQIIRFNQNATQLLTLDLMGRLKHWQIDYKNKEIKQLHAITHIPSYNCSFVDQNCIQLIGKDKIYYFNISKQYVLEQEDIYENADEQKEGMCNYINQLKFHFKPSKQNQENSSLFKKKLMSKCWDHRMHSDIRNCL